MPKEIETFASCKNGILKVSYRQKFLDAIASLGDTQGKLIYRKKFKKRSTKTYHEDGTEGLGQNGYYHAIVCQCYIDGVLAEQGRYITMEKADDELLNNCSYIEHYNEDTGGVMREIIHTSEMDTAQMEDYLERCRQFILEWFGIKVLLPHEQSELTLDEE